MVGSPGSAAGNFERPIHHPIADLAFDALGEQERGELLSRRQFGGVGLRQAQPAKGLGGWLDAGAFCFHGPTIAPQENRGKRYGFAFSLLTSLRWRRYGVGIETERPT